MPKSAPPKILINGESVILSRKKHQERKRQSQERARRLRKLRRMSKSLSKMTDEGSSYISFEVCMSLNHFNNSNQNFINKLHISMGCM